jgi:hypothetical protein
LAYIGTDGRRSVRDLPRIVVDGHSARKPSADIPAPWKTR